uniref:Putative major capsid protein n=1 Tax=viral metagenome TaxID=1070528 RepID=A0A6M3IF19_9ZZZZ
MGFTEFTTADALTQHKWSNSLAVEAAIAQYFGKFMGEGFNSMIRVLKDLTKNAGDKITYGLRMKLAGDGVEGDYQIEGTTAEEKLTFYSDYIFIDQRRKGTKSKGKMSEQRVAYNIRKEGHDALSTWWGEDYDQQIMIYAAGVRGINTFHVSTSWTGRAANTLTDVDTSHLIFAGDATGTDEIDEADLPSLEVVEKCISKAETTDPMMQPFMIGGESKFVLLMHTWQQHALRTNTSTGDWQDITKLSSQGKRNETIYQNALGEYAGVIMHKHRNVIRFNDYGEDGAQPAARMLFLGAQAITMAWGGTVLKGGGRERFGWNEETDDRGNQLVITSGSIFGTKATIFNSLRFGMIACDTYCKDPNA